MKSGGVMLYGLLATSPAAIRMSAVDEGMWSSIGMVMSAGLWNERKLVTMVELGRYNFGVLLYFIL